MANHRRRINLRPNLSAIVIIFATILIAYAWAWGGDMTHPSLPNGLHIGEPCLVGGTGCGGGGTSSPTATPSGQPTPNTLFANPQNIEIATDNAFGAVGDAFFSGDGTHLADGVTNHTTSFFSATGNFTANLIGDLIFIDGAGSVGGLYSGTITTVPNNNTVTLSNTPLTNVSSAHYVVGKDNTIPLQRWINAMVQSQVQQPKGYLPFGYYLHRALDFSGSGFLQIEGAGGGPLGGSALICIAPTSVGGVCHDFSGASWDKIQDLALWNGTSIQESGQTNVLIDYMTAILSGANNKFVDDTFRSFGPYNVVDYGGNNGSFIDDIFNGINDPAAALYLSSVNTPGFSSTTRGTLSVGPLPLSGVQIIGGKTRLAANNANAITLDEGQGNAISNISVSGATVQLTNSRGVSDTCTGSCALSSGVSLKSIALNNINWQATDAASRLVNVQGEALNWDLSGQAAYSAAPSNPEYVFNNGFLDGRAQIDMPAPNGGGPAFSSNFCHGSIFQIGNSGPILNTPCSVTAGSVSDYSGLRTVNIYPSFQVFNGNQGTATCTEPLQGFIKMASCSLGGYQELLGAQIYTFPSAFFNQPIIVNSGCGALNPTTSGIALTLPSGAGMTPETCNVMVLGQ